jgi:hypothetical protein
LCGWLLSVALILPWSSAQTSNSVTDSRAGASSLDPAVQELKQQISELRAAVSEIRSEAARYRAETDQLRQEVRTLHEEMASVAPSRSEPPAASLAAGPTPASLDQRVVNLEEQGQLLSAKVDDQYQTKVESASKYRLRLSGIVLLNVFSNRGVVDNQDIPGYVLYPDPVLPNGSFGATLRQSQIGLEAFGPYLAGARTSAQLQADFAGGFPNTPNGVTFGLMRLRTATMRLDWKNTSVVGGQDTAFISPLSPTSYASLATPAFSYAGNLWAWLPQVMVEHRFHFDNDRQLTWQGGVLDNLVGELPAYQWQNIPQAGERAGQPAYASRLAWTQNGLGSPMTIGVGGYYSRQDWWFGRHADGWAATADWRVPLSHGFGLSGEFYRGRGIGGLGGAFTRSVVFNGDLGSATSQIRGLNDIGGWSQLKYKVSSKLEFNGAFGMDNSFAGDLRAFSSSSQSTMDATLWQNRSYLANVIYRPHSNLVLSAEYQHLKTVAIDDDTVRSANQVNLVMGILF